MTDLISELITRGPEGDTYPQVTTQHLPDSDIVERIQIVVAPRRFAIVIRHPLHGHYNGYIKCAPVRWGQVRDFKSLGRIDYWGNGSDLISWMRLNPEGRLTIPTPVGDDANDNYWVGFSTYSPDGTRVSVNEVWESTIRLEAMINDGLSD